MTYYNGEKHLKEIDHVSILEYVDEVFDGITSLMTPNAVMYGSTITAIIAGLPIKGDLDIAVSKQEYPDITQKLANSVKWVQVDGQAVPESSNRHNSGFTFNSTPVVVRAEKKESPYSKAKHIPLSNTVAFQAVNDARVQIIESKAATGDILEDALAIVRKVDFVFCGIAVDRYGRMLEVIPGSYDDCLQRIIRVGRYQPKTDADQLMARFRKYIERGWYLGISLDQAVANLDKAKREYHAKLALKKGRKKAEYKRPLDFLVQRDTAKGLVIKASKILTVACGSSSLVRDTVRHFIGKHFSPSSSVKHATRSSGDIVFWTDVPMKPAIANKVISDSRAYLKSKTGVDNAVLEDRKLRDENIKHMYGRATASNSYTVGYTAGNSVSK